MKPARRAGTPTAAPLALALALVLAWPAGCRDAGGSLPSVETIVVSVLAVGDTGRSHRSLPALFEGQIAVANGMVAEDRRAAVSAVLLLGDNFYLDGLHRDTMVDRIQENVVYPYCHFSELRGTRSADVASACRLAESDRHPVPIYAVIGNHDLRDSWGKSLQCREVSAYVSNWYMPCGYAETIEVPGGLSLILFDSEMEAGAAERAELLQSLRESKGPWRLMAAHRPVSIDRTDRAMRDGFVHKLIQQSGVSVHAYLSGHNHSLQLHVTNLNGPPLQGIVGSGSRARPPIEGDAPSRVFGASRLGFARVDIVESDGVERLVMSLFQTPDYPILARGHPELVASYSIGRDFDVRDELAWVAAASD